MRSNDSLFTCPNCGSDNIDIQAYTDRLVCRQCRNIFPKIKVFFSYKHDIYIEQIKSIQNKLTDEGFCIWMDEQIKELSPSWRNALRTAISQSDIVLAFISKGYLDSTVCNDELRIAACNSLNAIRTIILENDNTVIDSIPEFISDPQRFDISDWIQCSLNKSDASQASEQERLCKIINVLKHQLSNPENKKRFVEMINLQKKLKPYLPLRRNEANMSISYCGRELILNKQADLKDTYCGRQWLAEICEKWRCQESTHSLLLYGRPGIGKSTFLAHYIRNNPYFPSAFFCKWDDQEHCTANTIIRTIAYQLAQTYPEYRSELIDVLEDQTDASKRKIDKELLELALLGRTSVSELFHYLITEPLIRCSFSDRKERYVVVIDAINEMNSNELEQLSQAIYQELPQLPEWLCFLFTSQKTDEVSHLFSFIASSTIPALDKENLQDIAEYTEKNLSHEGWSETDRKELVKQICQRSEGIFLYASFVVQAINAGTIQISLSEDHPFDALPGNLIFAIRKYISRIVATRDEFERNYRDIFSVICASPEPLPIKHIYKALSIDKYTVEDRLAQFEPFIHKQIIDGVETVSLSHQSYYSFFTNRNDSQYYYCPKEVGNNLLANLFLSYYTKKQFLYLSVFLLKNFLPILEQCEEEKWDDLVEIIDDTDYLRFAVKRLFDLGYIVESNKLCLQILDRAKKVKSKGMYVTLARIQKRLALNYFNHGKVTLGRTLLIESEEKYLPHIQGNFALKASTFSNIAWSAREDNDLPLADAYLEKAKCLLNNLGNDHESEDTKADIQYVQGAILYKKFNKAPEGEKEGIYIACKTALDESVRIWKTLGEEDNDALLQITFSNMILGGLHKNRKEYRLALSLYREILEIREKIFQDNPNSPYIAKALGNIATVCVIISEEEKDEAYLEEASKTCERAISIYNNIHKDRDMDYNVAVFLITKGDILRLQNDYKGAVQAYNKALEIFSYYGESKRSYINQIEEKLKKLTEGNGVIL